MEPEQLLEYSVTAGDHVGILMALTLNCDVSKTDDPMGMTPLHMAAWHGHAQCVATLVAAGASVSATAHRNLTPLHMAALGNTQAHAECVTLLLTAGADPLAKTEAGETAHHLAAQRGAVWALRRLLMAAPTAALAVDSFNRTPLDNALVSAHCDPPGRWTRNCTASAFVLLQHSPPHLERLGAVLTYLATKDRWSRLLYAPLLLRHPLTAAQWELIPPNLPCLGVALPSVMERSQADAPQLVRRMTGADRQHLRTTALCLGAAQRNGTLPQLPSDIVRLVLLQAAAQHGQHQLRQHITDLYHRENPRA